MSTRKKRDQLVEEFHVQVYSSGRVDWDRLDRFLPARSLDPRTLAFRLRDRLTESAQAQVLHS